MLGGPTNSGKSSLANSFVTGIAQFENDDDILELFPESLSAETRAYWTLRTGDSNSL
jgi:GTPase SAR1 family protein